ncbi:MAG TPA: medium chain dehydrogenase/reductase family protein [Terriglobales bacterium]|nr:medium chain dehydrogenase/reductase family protein [Terriglobales bacterium]
MHAMVVRRYGPPEVMEWREVPDPKPAAGQALIRVRAIGINFADILARLGVYSTVPKPPFVPGLELAGEVEQVPGASETTLKVGDRVAALTMFNAYAERVAVNAEQAFPIPDGMTFEEAAAIPVNYLTAWQSMFEMGNLRAGDRILITSAAGGVGVAAVQLARAHGIVTFGTAGPAKQDFLRQTGVDHPIDYTRQSALEVVRRAAPEGIEMALDAIGGNSFRQSYRCLGPMGRLVVYGFSTVVGPKGKLSYLHGAKEMLETPRFHPLKLIDRNIAVIGVHIGKLAHKSRVLRPQLEEIFRLYHAGRVKPVIGKTFSLKEAAAAHQYIHDRKNVGKVVLMVDQG